MSLPARERRKLAAIERAEARTNPGLAARFAIFNQLSLHAGHAAHRTAEGA